jgi:hypothetical protein
MRTEEKKEKFPLSCFKLKTILSKKCGSTRCVLEMSFPQVKRIGNLFEHRQRKQTATEDSGRAGMPPYY